LQVEAFIFPIPPMLDRRVNGLAEIMITDDMLTSLLSEIAVIVRLVSQWPSG